MNIYSLPLKNIIRRPMSSSAIFIGMASISFMIFILSLLYLSIVDGINKGVSRMGADAVILPGERQGNLENILLTGGAMSLYMDSGIVERARSVDGVSAATAQLYITSARLKCCSISNVTLIGYEPDKDFTITPWLKETLSGPLERGEIIAGADILSEPGGRLVFYGKPFKIKGKLEPTGIRLIDSAVYMPMPDAREMIEDSKTGDGVRLEIKPDEISAVLVNFKEGANHEKTAIRLEYELSGTRVVLAGDMMRTFKKNLLLPLKSAVISVIVQWAVSMIFIGAVFSLSVFQRLREIWLMRAMGAKRKVIFLTFISEAALLSISGCIVGIILGAGVLISMKAVLEKALGMRIMFHSSTEYILLTCALILLSISSVIAVTYYPVKKAYLKSLP